MEGVKVLDFGTYLAGPLLCRHLSGLGCEVTCVLRPPHCRGAEEESRRLPNVHSELRKTAARCVQIDLPTERQLALQLVSETDLLVENFGAGVMERLGIGYDECVSVNPSLLYVSMPGFPDDGEEHPPAFESALLASAGVFRDMGLNRKLLGVEASYTHLPLASVYGSVHALFATLVAHHSDQRPSHLVVPLLSALSETMVHNSIQMPVDSCYWNLRTARIRDGRFPISKSQLRDVTCPFFCLYACNDGRFLYLVCPAHARHQTRTLQVLGVEDLVMSHLEVAKPYDERARGLGTGSLSQEQADRIRPILESAFRTKTALEWEEELGKHLVPACATRSTEEWMTSSHAVDSGLVGGSGGLLCNLVWTHDEKPCPPPPHQVAQKSHAPKCGAPHPLSGVKVVDLCNVIAGPTIGEYLARMGADVIKVDPPVPTYSPEITVMYGVACNRGKRSVLLDVLHPKGREVLHSLLEDADLLLVNCTPQALVRMGLTMECLRARHPRLLLMRFDAWGGPSEGRGRMADFVGYDDCVQSGIGIMQRFGSGEGEPEEHAHIGTIDVVAGVAGACACVNALLRRRRHRVTCVARTSLAAVGQYLQIPFMTRERRTFLGRGVACVGEHALHRAVRLSKTREWIFVQSRTWSPSDAPFARVVRHARRTAESTEEACRLICESRRGVAVPLPTMDQVRASHFVETARSDERAPGLQFVHHVDHPVGSVQIVARHCLRGLSLPDDDTTHAPKYGAHTRALLPAPLLAEGVAADAWSRCYIPFSTPCDSCHLRGRRRYLHSSCAHSVCIRCRKEASCPVCGAPCLDAKVWTRWKTEYSNWRRGKSKGAKGELAARSSSSTPRERRARSAPP